MSKRFRKTAPEIRPADWKGRRVVIIGPGYETELEYLRQHGRVSKKTLPHEDQHPMWLVHLDSIGKGSQKSEYYKAASLVVETFWGYLNKRSGFGAWSWRSFWWISALTVMGTMVSFFSSIEEGLAWSLAMMVVWGIIILGHYMQYRKR